MKAETQLEEIFQRMKDIPKEFSDLDLQKEHDVNRLEELQSEQASLRAQANKLMLEIPEAVRSPKLMLAINQCLDDELILMEKLLTMQTDYSHKLKEFKDATMSRQRYMMAHSQIKGYFMDRQQ